MRKLLVIGATVFAGLAIGGTALAASGPDRRDDNPAGQVSTSDDSSVTASPSGAPDDHGVDPTDTAGPYPSASTDDHGGDPTVTAGSYPSASTDDHGGERGGHGADDGPGDDHGGRR